MSRTWNAVQPTTRNVKLNPNKMLSDMKTFDHGTGEANILCQMFRWYVKNHSCKSLRNGMFIITQLTKKTESARMVAAAGLTLKQENMKARLKRVQAFTVSSACAAM